MTLVNVGQPVSALAVDSGVGGSGSFSSFSPNSGSTYVVCISAKEDGAGTTPTSTVSWSSGGSGSWTQIGTWGYNAYWPQYFVWAVKCTSAPGASVIAVTGTNVDGFLATVSELTGAAAVGSILGTTANSVVVSATTITLTPSQVGSLLFSMLLDQSENFSVTANGSSTLLATSGVVTGETLFVMASNALTSGSAVTLGSSTGTPTGSTQYAVEILPAPNVASTLSGIAWAGTQVAAGAASSGSVGVAGVWWAGTAPSLDVTEVQNGGTPAIAWAGTTASTSGGGSGPTTVAAAVAALAWAGARVVATAAGLPPTPGARYIDLTVTITPSGADQ